MSGIEYDAEADALYIHLTTEDQSSGRLHTYQSPRHHDVSVDVVDGVLVGVEVLSASRHPLFSGLVPRMSGGRLSRFKSVFRDREEA